jgi:hypothetical protein|tara:strand:- start:4 stop:129 length:126 start_codon:yes stop_codon:yes gene_type:complete
MDAARCCLRVTVNTEEEVPEVNEVGEEVKGKKRGFRIAWGA